MTSKDEQALTQWAEERKDSKTPITRRWFDLTGLDSYHSYRSHVYEFYTPEGIWVFFNYTDNNTWELYMNSAFIREGIKYIEEVETIYLALTGKELEIL